MHLAILTINSSYINLENQFGSLEILSEICIEFVNDDLTLKKIIFNFPIFHSISSTPKEMNLTKYSSFNMMYSEYNLKLKELLKNINIIVVKTHKERFLISAFVQSHTQIIVTG